MKASKNYPKISPENYRKVWRDFYKQIEYERLLRREKSK